MATERVLLRMRDSHKRLGNASRTLPWRVRRNDIAILLVSLMLYPATALAQPTERASGARHNDIGEQMRNVARRMTLQEIDAASRFYADSL
jgi:hypothetical protein